MLIIENLRNERKRTVIFPPYFLVGNNIKFWGTFISIFFPLGMVFYVDMVILYIKFFTLLFKFNILFIAFLYVIEKSS